MKSCWAWKLVRLASIISLCGPLSEAAHAKIEAIAFEDSVTGPNGDVGAIFAGLLNSNGRVAFYGLGSNGDDAIAVARPEAAHFIVREGDHAPGTATGVNFESIDKFDDIRWNDFGQVAFLADLTGPDVNLSNQSGLWAGAPGNVRLMAHDGDLIAGSGTVRIDHLAEEYDLGGDGYVAFRAVLDDTRTGIWAGTQGNLQLLALDGQPAVGFAGRIYNVASAVPDHVSINHANRLAFMGTAANELNSVDAVWAGTPDNLQVVAYQDMDAPGFVAGSRVLYLSNPPQINEADEVAFTAGVEEPGAGIAWDTLYLRTGGGLTRMFDPKSIPPGFDAGDEYGVILNYHLGGEGKAVFLSPVFLANNQTQDALFAVDDGVVRLIAQEGDQIPGATGDLHFENFTQHYINGAGDVAFMAGVSGNAAQTGIWIDNGSGELLEIARIGQPLEVAPGDARIVESLSLVDSDYSDPQITPFNDAGQLVFLARFANSAALLLYSPSGIPGDYNGDSVVDSADYTVWRDHLNTSTNLPNDETPGFVDAGDYTVWKSHFGQSEGGGSIVSLHTQNVPEPSGDLLILASLIVAAAICRSRHSAGIRYGLPC